jgi:hypothetical protein
VSKKRSASIGNDIFTERCLCYVFADNVDERIKRRLDFSTTTGTGEQYLKSLQTFEDLKAIAFQYAPDSCFAQLISDKDKRSVHTSKTSDSVQRNVISVAAEVFQENAGRGVNVAELVSTLLDR